MNAPDQVKSIDLQEILRDADVEPVMAQLENELIGLAPVKARICAFPVILVPVKLQWPCGWQKFCIG